MKSIPLRAAVAAVLTGLTTAQIYQTDFSTAQGWTLSSSGCNPAWAWGVDGTPASHFDGAFRSAPASLNFNDGTSVGPVFGAIACGSATSPPIDLSQSAGDVRVEFWLSYDFNQDSGCAIDSTRFQLSSDGFATLILDECLPVIGQLRAGWHRLEFVLSPLWGTVQLRFDFLGSHGVGFNTPTGPFIDDLTVWEVCPPFAYYCVTSPNTSFPSGASIGALGSSSIAANDLRLHATNAVRDTFAIFFYGSTPAQTPTSNGFLCVGGTLFRLPAVSTGPSGTPSWTLDVGAPPQPAGTITAGSTWFFQCWFRDGATTSNFSDGMRISFCP